MKMLKKPNCEKIVTWSLVVMFSFLQIVPTGWAANTPADELQARSVPASVEALANPAAPQPAPASQKTVASLDSIAFQLNENPLSPATPELTARSLDVQNFIEPLRNSGGIQLNGPAAPANGTLAQTPEPTTQTAGQLNIPEPPRALELTPIEPPVIDTSIPPASEDHGNTMTVTTTVTETETEIVTDPIPTVVPPKDTTAITDPNSGRKLSVHIDEHGIATVKWGDQEYKGFFDARTNSVILVTNDNSVWTLQFAPKATGELYLQTFQTRNWNGANYSEETYTFNQQNQLTRKDWLNENYGYYDYGCTEGEICAQPTIVRYPYYPTRSGGTIDYVQINGKTLVSHEKNWSEGGWDYIVYNRTTADSTNSLYPYDGNRSEYEVWYSYDNQGNLTARSWANNNGWGNSYGQETYVQINGKTLLSSSKVFQYGSPRKWIYIDDPITFDGGSAIKEPVAEYIYPIRMPPISLWVSSHTETFYSYDLEGNLVSEVNASEGYDYNNVRHTSGYYWLRDAVKNTWTYASAEGIDPFAVWFRQDISGIKAAAQRMTVYVGGNGERYNSTHRVEYTRNADGLMTAKAVYDNANNVFIVRGEPDVMSGETNDIKLVNWQQTNGHYVTYSEYGHSDENGNWVNDGYRLIFYDQNTWAQTAVDFPAKDTVTLNGINYKITLDQDGFLHLENTLPPAVQAIQQAVKVGLANTFGFTQVVLDQLVKDGKIVIKVDLEHLTATVTIDPSVTLPAGAVNLTDPLGLNRLPGEIHYDLGSYTFEMGVACSTDPAIGCPHASPTYFLKAGSFNIGPNYSVQMNFLESETDVNGDPVIVRFIGDNRLHSVSISSEPVCDGPICPQYVTREIKDIVYRYSSDTQAADRIRAVITYHDGSQGDVVSRDVELQKMEDGQYHIQTVVDKDANGNVIATSQFNYISTVTPPQCTENGCEPQAPSVVGLVDITRTDADGKPLSEIVVNDGRALITFPDGVTKVVHFASLEDLLAQARRLELLELETNIREAVLNDLSKITGLSIDQLERLIVAYYKNPNFGEFGVEIRFAAGKMSNGYLIDILGNGDVPSDVSYRLAKDAAGHLIVVEAMVVWHPETEANIALIAYESGRISAINWYSPPNTSHREEYNYDGEKITIKRSTYLYAANTGWSLMGIRTSTLIRMEDGQYHIQTVTDKDANGNVIATSKFNYLVLHTGGGLGPIGIGVSVALESITRIDVDGKALSEIAINASGASIALPDGKTQEVQFASLEQLLDLARQFEQETARAIAAVKASVQAGLLNTFGFTQAALDQWIKDGKIVIKVDLEKLTATVTIDPSVTLPARAVNLTDPLGTKGLPGEIRYELGSFTFEMGVACRIGEPCPHASPTYFLKSGSFNIGSDYFVQMNFLGAESGGIVRFVGDNRLHVVEIFNGDPTPICTGELCAARLALKVISYEYSDDASVVRVHIVYNLSNGIFSRDLEIKRMEDGQYHIQTVTDKDAAGNVIANSKFNYLVAIPDCIVSPDGSSNCGGAQVILESITRTDASGNPLSEIVIHGDGALITLSDGRTKEVQYASLEVLLDLARRFETEPVLPSIPDYVLPYVLSQFGISLEDIVAVNKVEPGMVCLATGCPTWAFYIELTARVNGKEVLLSGMVNGPSWGKPIFAIDLLPMPKTLSSPSSGSVTESSLNTETSTTLSLAPLQSSPIRSSNLRRIGSRSALRSLVSPKFQADSSDALTAYQQASSLKASPVFGFEGSALFGNLLKELTQ